MLGSHENVLINSYLQLYVYVELEFYCMHWINVADVFGRWLFPVEPRIFWPEYFHNIIHTPEKK